MGLFSNKERPCPAGQDGSTSFSGPRISVVEKMGKTKSALVRKYFGKATGNHHRDLQRGYVLVEANVDNEPNPEKGGADATLRFRNQCLINDVVDNAYKRFEKRLPTNQTVEQIDGVCPRCNQVCELKIKYHPPTGLI